MSAARLAREYLRQCLAEPHWMRYETALRRDVEAVLDALDAVEALHQPIVRLYCVICGDSWPCDTARALGVDE